ncbi:hypothetical protein ACERII_15040 [Evansella sp. AB-rgal1]|uniref:hypothetical protein n=1 Tax=Evansella sp. AB-rgal1 TaxID=3242696 RepID=UPI00359DAE0D
MDKTEKSNKKNWLRRGLVIGAFATSVYIFSNKKTRTKVVQCATDCKDKTKHWVEVIRDNREPFVDQLRNSGDKISRIVEDASDDIQNLVESTKQMKSHTLALLEALQETKDEFQSLATRLRIDAVEVQELLPSSEDEDLLQ